MAKPRKHRSRVQILANSLATQLPGMVTAVEQSSRRECAGSGRRLRRFSRKARGRGSRLRFGTSAVLTIRGHQTPSRNSKSGTIESNQCVVPFDVPLFLSRCADLYRIKHVLNVYAVSAGLPRNGTVYDDGRQFDFQSRGGASNSRSGLAGRPTGPGHLYSRARAGGGSPSSSGNVRCNHRSGRLLPP